LVKGIKTKRNKAKRHKTSPLCLAKTHQLAVPQFIFPIHCTKKMAQHMKKRATNASCIPKEIRLEV